MTTPTPERPYLVVSGDYYFESERHAQRHGVSAEQLTAPKRGGDHRLLDLVSMVRIPAADWQARQDGLDAVLDDVVERARATGIVLPADGVFLRVRISFVGDEDDGQLGYALPSGFLRRWGELGGAVMVDA